MASAGLPAVGNFSENLTTVLYHLQVVRYITVAALVFNIWDYIISFPSEVELVWIAPASYVKFLFLLNRYLGPAILMVNVNVLVIPSVTDDVCEGWFKLEGWGGLIVVVVVQVILILRVTALYERNVTVSRILVLLLLGHVIASSVILGLGLSQVKPLRFIGPIFLGCVTPAIPKFFFSLFIPHLVVETTLFTLTVNQSIKSLQKGNWYSAPMFVLLLRDGTVYFFAMFGVTFITTFTWLFAPPSLMKVAVAPMIALSSVSGCRIILNLRALHEEKNHSLPELNLETFDLGDLELRTLPNPKTTMGTGDSNTFRRRSEAYHDLDKQSTRSTATMVGDDVSRYAGSIYGGPSAGRSKWVTFDNASSAKQMITGFDRRPQRAGAGGWRGDFVDIRRESQQPSPRPPALPVPPPASGHSRQASAHVRTLCGTPGELEMEHRRRPSEATTFSFGSEDETSPLSPKVRHHGEPSGRFETWV